MAPGTLERDGRDLVHREMEIYPCIFRSHCHFPGPVETQVATDCSFTPQTNYIYSDPKQL